MSQQRDMPGLSLKMNKGICQGWFETGVEEKANHFVSVPHEFRLFNGLIISFSNQLSVEGIRKWNVSFHKILLFFLCPWAYFACVCTPWIGPEEKDPDTARLAVLPRWAPPHHNVRTRRDAERECVSDRQDVREGKGLGVRDKVGGKYSKGERKRWKD